MWQIQLAQAGLGLHYKAEDDIGLMIFLSARIMVLCGAVDAIPGFIHDILYYQTNYLSIFFKGSKKDF